MVAAPTRCSIAIPVPLQRRCGLRAEDRVLLAAMSGQDTLPVYPLAVVDRALTPLPRGEGGCS
jgi:hypothetical protein